MIHSIAISAQGKGSMVMCVVVKLAVCRILQIIRPVPQPEFSQWEGLSQRAGTDYVIAIGAGWFTQRNQTVMRRSHCPISGVGYECPVSIRKGDPVL